jgi:hypothetical protein
MTFPQYAKTNHPKVLEAVRETLRRDREFGERVQSMAAALTGDQDAGYVNGDLFDKKVMVGIATKYKDQLPGRWKKPDGGCVKPYKNNPISEEISSIRYKAVRIPGRDNLVFGVGYLGTGTVFEYEGWVYSGYGFQTEHSPEDQDEFGWVEIMPSEFYKAVEDENERRRKLRESDG